MSGYKAFIASVMVALMLCIIPHKAVAQDIDLLDVSADDFVSGESMPADESQITGVGNMDATFGQSANTGTYAASGTTGTMTKEEAKETLDRLIKEARSGEPGSLEKYRELVLAMEVLSPESNARDITRFLRRVYYSDDQLQFAGVTAGEGEPTISPELAAYENKIYGLKKWQLLDKGDGSGKKFDFGHSLVGLDAYSWNPGVGGRARGYLFTFLGDYGSQVFTWCGADGAGDWNKEDHAGNLFGRRMTNLYSDNHDMKLSDMMTQAHKESQKDSGATLEDFYFF